MLMAWKDVEVGSEKMDQIRHELHTLLRGLRALPINLPGFTYYKSRKAKLVLVSLMLKSIAKRREANIELNDFRNNLMKMTAIEVPDYDICCIMVVFMFASTDTTSALISWVVKYLHDFPEVRQRVQVSIRFRIKP
ncbi:abscisic acid 8'-hydroxylase 2-like [Physcomitrium patens]|uniref:abscisic acid 8'-hydroxylase 2-like n=1 Tax=Physcomitrium patens TaxID=3218 RepID=UPI000D15711F|nr:abscisic acid 8'-hydroxylase 2-like [Physcomitrium patens]|eukprot:XP_024379222.1 abscisic acid 8'-hydroxylase 2-like [Physcomitrella patens]